MAQTGDRPSWLNRPGFKGEEVQCQGNGFLQHGLTTKNPEQPFFIKASKDLDGEGPPDCLTTGYVEEQCF